MHLRALLTALLASLLACTQPTLGQTNNDRNALAENYGKLPLSFESNQGQTDPKVQFLSRGHGYSLFLTGSAAVLSLRKPDTVSGQQDRTGQARRAPDSPPETDVVQMELLGSSRGRKLLGMDPLPGTANYFTGNDPAKWHSRVPTYGKVEYPGIYPGVDLVFYGNQRQLEYDFVVSPGANPRPIHLHFTGAQKLELAASGDLNVSTKNGQIQLRKPVIYQGDGGERRAVEGHFTLLAGNTVSFVLGHYDHSKPLIIDPVLVYSTYLGGTNGGSFGGDLAAAIAVDKEGNAYVAGQADSTDFPVTPGSFQTVNNSGGTYAFVTKLNSTGTSLIYSTYIGATNSGYGFGIAVDNSGEAYITGATGASNFPVTVGAYQQRLAGHIDVFVTKLDPTGSALIYSTYLGGSGVDAPSGITLDASGDAYVAGMAQSANFPVSPGAFQATNRGASAGGNAFVTELNSSGSALLYSTFLGGSGNDSASGIAVDSSGNAFVTGTAHSSDFPTTSGAFQTAAGFPAGYGGHNAFVAALNSTGTGLLYSTYLGGNYADNGNGIAVDGSDDAYVTGLAYSSNFPVTPGAFQTSMQSASGYAFVTKLNPTGTALLYSTFLGGKNPLGSADVGSGIAIDALGDAFITGTANSSSFPVTANALQPTDPGNKNAFVTELNPAGSALLYSTYFGGSAYDAGTCIAVDAVGDVYVAGQSLSGDFPTTGNAFQTVNRGFANGDANAFAAKLLLNPVPAVSLSLTSIAFGTEAVGFQSGVQTSTVTNVGTSALTISKIALTGANPSSFLTSNTCGSSVAVGASCTIRLRFYPQTPGARSAALTITDNANGTPHSIALTGTGIVPTTVSLSPSSIDFGNGTVGVESGVQTTTLKNTGSTALTITSIALTGANRSSFLTSNNCGTSLAVGASCTIRLRFDAKTTGPLSAALIITDNATGSPQSVALTGTGVLPTEVALSPTSLSFGITMVGSQSDVQTSTLTNVGASALTIYSIALSGANYTSFLTSNNCGTSLAPGASCTIRVRLHPQIIGAVTAALTISGNATDLPESIALGGTGTAKEKVLYSFTGNLVDNVDGYELTGNLVMDRNGNLFGTTYGGGIDSTGVVFELTPSGTETVLHSFVNNGTDGFYPNGGLVLDSQGNLYGTTHNGGAYGVGSVFKVTQSGSETVLYSFGSHPMDGTYPVTGLVLDTGGNLYGMTGLGGTAADSGVCSGGCGTVFKVTPAGTETTLYSFTGADGAVYNTGNPGYGSLVLDGAGNLYGTTYNGGDSGYGTVFKVTPGGTETVLHSFAQSSTDGYNPSGALILDGQGNLYGTTFGGGAYFDMPGGGGGTVFKITPSGSETLLYSFPVFSSSPGLWGPQASLALDKNNNLYGTTGEAGGVFKLTSSGDLTVLHPFPLPANDGTYPNGGLIFDSKGNLYGVTEAGGSAGGGTVYEVTP